MVLYPPLLVFGSLPSFPAVKMEAPEQLKLMEALQTSSQEMESVSAHLHVQEALSSKLTHATYYPISLGDSVHVSREDKYTVRNTGHWVMPFSATSDIGNQDTVDYNQEPNNFNISQLLPDPSLIGERELDRMIAAFNQLPSDCKYLYRSLRQALVGLTSTGPDICADVNLSTQVTEKN